MARGNSKLYRVKQEHIMILEYLNSEPSIQYAFESGYMFVADKELSKVCMINTTCSRKTLTISVVNVDVIREHDVKEVRF
jgi:uncharacterized protein YigE (DUF2233 family)